MHFLENNPIIIWIFLWNCSSINGHRTFIIIGVIDLFLFLGREKSHSISIEESIEEIIEENLPWGKWIQGP
jgi:hypothetical protein